MSRRAGDWHLLGCEEDPVPASGAEVDVVRDDMRERSDAARDIHDTLSKLADLDGWRGKAAETFAEKAEDVLEDLGKVRDRYDAVADALSSWGDDVETARTATGNALTKAETAKQTMDHNPKPTSTGTEPPTPEQEAQGRRHDDAAGDLSAAQGDLRSALDDLDSAADRAKKAIEDAADIWDDGWWGDVKGWVRYHAELIKIICKVLEVVGLILGAIILVCAIVASAPFWLVAAAIAAGVLLLVGHSLLAASDEGSWSDVAMDVVGLALTFVGGKAAASALKGMKGLVPVMAGRLGNEARAATMASEIGDNAAQFRNALRIQNPLNNLSRWTQGITSNADNAAAAMSGRVEALLQLKPTTLRSILSQDRSLARVSTVLGELRTLGPTADEAARLAQIARLNNLAIGVGTYGTITSLKGAIASIRDAWSAIFGD